MFIPVPSCDTKVCPPSTQVPGPQGPQGDGVDGTNGVSAFSFATAGFVQPAIAANVTVPVASSIQFALGSYVWVEVAGEMKVISKPTVTSIELQNTGWAGNAAAAALIPNSVQISPTGKSSGTP